MSFSLWLLYGDPCFIMTSIDTHHCLIAKPVLEYGIQNYTDSTENGSANLSERGQGVLSQKSKMLLIKFRTYWAIQENINNEPAQLFL